MNHQDIKKKLKEMTKPELRALFENAELEETKKWLLKYAYIDESKTKIGYEISFTKYFYKYQEPRKTEDIMNEILELDKKLDGVLKELQENE